jgi:hypothetical protein
MINLSEEEMVIDFKSYKWIVSSCLQKSLRRGRYDLAETYLNFLWEHDRNYITYRLGTILTEDVGIANIPLVNEYLETKLAKKKIDEKGGLEFLLNLTQQACSSPKDRSSCDCAYLSSFYSFSIESQITNLSKLERIQLLTSIIDNPTTSYIEKIHASWIILGTRKFKNELLPKFTDYPYNDKGETIDDIEAYISSLTNLSIHNELITLIKNAYLTQVENISLGIPIVKNLFDKEFNNIQTKIPVGDIIEHTYIQETTIFHPGINLNLISCGIDGHTREGKSAYNKFLNTKNQFTDYMHQKNIPKEKHMIIFSHCMFRVEGHEVNKRLYFPSAVSIMRDCEQKILNIKIGQENILDFNIIKKIIINDMPKINTFRINEIEISPIPKIVKPIPKIKK